MTRPARTAEAELLRLRTAGVNPATALLLAVATCRSRLSASGRWPDRREHGSEKGWRQHRTDGIKACAPCRAAHSRHVLADRSGAA